MSASSVLRVGLRVLGSLLCVVGALALGWGILLVTTGDDPDGARFWIGWMLTGWGAAAFLVGAVVVWKSDPRFRGAPGRAGKV